MDAVRLLRATGWCGVAAGILAIAVVPLYFLYSDAPPASNVLTRNLITLVLCAFLFGFLVGLRELVARVDLNGLATFIFGAGVLYLAVTLVAISLEVGVVLETSNGTVDPTVDGPIAHANMLLHGSVARLLTAMLLAAAGYAIWRTGFLPRSVGVAAYLVAAVNLAFVPSLYFGTDAAVFYSAVGWGNSAMAAALFTLWILVAGIAALLSRGSAAWSSDESVAARSGIAAA